MQADPIQTLDYSFRSVKTTRDTTNVMKISAALSVDFADEKTTVKVAGSGAYAKSETRNFRQENIVVSYDTLTYQVRVRPSAALVVAPQVKALLQPGRE